MQDELEKARQVAVGARSEDGTWLWECFGNVCLSVSVNVYVGSKKPGKSIQEQTAVCVVTVAVWPHQDEPGHGEPGCFFFLSCSIDKRFQSGFITSGFTSECLLNSTAGFGKYVLHMQEFKCKLGYIGF